MRALLSASADDLRQEPTARSKQQSIDARELKIAASGRWYDIMQAVTGIGSGYLDSQLEGPCPRCADGGNTRFRVYPDFRECGGMRCNRCGSFADGIAAIGWLNGVNFKESLHLVADAIGFDGNDATFMAARLSPPPTTKRNSKADITDPVADLRDRVYSRLGELLGLSDSHRLQLRKRGLTDEEISYRKYFSVGKLSSSSLVKLRSEFATEIDDVARNVPGVFPGRSVTINAKNALMVPVRDATGRIVAMQIRPDNQAKGKYLWLSSASAKNQGEFYPSPGSPLHVSLPSLNGNEAVGSSIRLTEGPLKSDVATAISGLSTIAVAGAALWKSAIDFIESRTGECLRLSFDADAIENTAVARATTEAFDYFSRRESKVVVSVECWTAEKDKDGNFNPKGVDDALLAGTPIRVYCDAEAKVYIKTLRNAAKPPPLQNYVDETIDIPDGKGGSNEKEIKSPLSVRQIAEALTDCHDGWPKASSGQLFTFDKERDLITFLNSANKLFAFARREKSVDWANGESLLTKAEFFEGLPMFVEQYKDIQRHPHFPPLVGSFYTCEIPDPGDGESLESLLDYFSPNEFDIDRSLMKAFIVTLFWGGPPGARPGWLITSRHGTGQGKSTFVSSLASLVGGCYEFSSDTNDEKIRTGLLTPDESGRRVALLDNVKTGRLSNSSIESLITSPTIGGHRLHAGFASRENFLTWAITMNGAALSRDMAERCVNIQLGKPSHSGQWEESLREFIESHRSRIIADVAGFFRLPTKVLGKYSRWGRWERDVLSRLPDPDLLQAKINERSKTANADSEDAETIAEFFRKKILTAFASDSVARSKNVPLSRYVIHIPTKLAATWISDALGEDISGHSAGKMIDRLHSSGGLPNIKRNPSRTNGRGVLWSGGSFQEEVDYEFVPRNSRLGRFLDPEDVF